jgi:hypothetical protein
MGRNTFSVNVSAAMKVLVDDFYPAALATTQSWPMMQSRCMQRQFLSDLFAILSSQSELKSIFIVRQNSAHAVHLC